MQLTFGGSITPFHSLFRFSASSILPVLCRTPPLSLSFPGSLRRITGGSRAAPQTTHGWPTSCSCLRPKRVLAFFSCPGKRYTITESRCRSITSSTSLIILTRRSGDSRTLEDRELHTLAVLLADLRHAAQPGSSLPGVGFRDVVGYQDVHSIQSAQDERWVARQIAPQMPRQQGGLHGGQRPPAHHASRYSVLKFRLLVLFPGLD